MKWQWELDVIKALNITDNVVHLMIEKLNTLPEQSQEVLKIASCIGSEFDIQTVADMSSYSFDEVLQSMQVPLQENLVNVMDEVLADGNEQNERYQFLHDRIQQASYALIPEETRASVHLSIGKHLLQNLSEEEINNGLFEITNHLNIGVHLADDPSLKSTLIELNMKSGQRAKSSLAYRSATEFFDQAIELMLKDYWDNPQLYPLAYECTLNKGECMYMMGNHEEAIQFMDEVIDHAHTKLEKARVYILKGILLQTQGKLLEELETCRAGLALFGKEIPQSQSLEEIMGQFGKLETLRAGRPIPELIDLPIMQDPEQYTIQTLLIIASTPTYMTDQTKLVWTWVITEIINISLVYGNSPLSELAYSGYGIIVGSSGDYQSGYAYGKLAFDLNTNFNNIGNVPKINVIYGQMVAPWVRPLKEVLPLAYEGMAKAYESGDLVYGAYSGLHLLWGHLFLSTPLDQLGKEIVRVTKFFEKTKDIFIDSVYVAEQYIEALRGNTDNITSFGTEKWTDTEFETRIESKAMDFSKHNFYLAKAITHYLNHDYDAALEYVPKLQQTAYATTGCLFNADQEFYHGLAFLGRILPGQEPSEDDINLINGIIQKMDLWANNSPSNFEAKYFILLAEKAYHMDRNGQKAEELFDQAINSASKYTMLREEALANERAAIYFHNTDREKITKTYLKDAVKCYTEWGAFGKIKQLQNTFTQFGELFNVLDEQELTLHTLTSNTISSTQEILDWQSVAKTTAAISSEVVLEELLAKLVQVLIEAAGAENCSFIQTSQEQGKQFIVEAYGSIQGNKSSTILQKQIATEENYPLNVLRYVQRTKKVLVLPNAVQSDEFNQSTYIQNRNIKSIACLPVLLQDKLNGIIYLENNLSTDVFNEARLEVLKLLAAQTAISFENAVIYRDMEQKVQERTQIIESQKTIIEQEKNKADQLLYNILPRSTANELKQNGEAEPRSFEQVTILFSDFVGFTQITEELTPKELISDLNVCFLAFDDIVEQNNMERIKTIGDAYMCAGGVPMESETHAIDAINAAIQIRDFIRRWNTTRANKGKRPWQVRIGIHTGSVIAGVVGKKRFAYDIWGDAVNIAARMEESGEQDQINISSFTHSLIKDQFDCEYRGRIDAKNKGEIDMYFVK